MPISRRGPFSLAACIVLNAGSTAAAGLPPFQVDSGLLGAGSSQKKIDPTKTESVLTKNAPAVASEKSVNTSAVTAESATAAKRTSVTQSSARLTTAKTSEATTVVESTQISADTMQGVTDRELIAEGKVDLRKGDTRLIADKLTHRQPEDIADASGNVVLTRNGEEISGPHLRLNLTESTGFFDNPTYRIHTARQHSVAGVKTHDDEQVGHGTAARLDFEGEGKYRLNDATYSTCAPAANGSTDWFATVSSLFVDRADDVGSGRNATVYFKGVPIFFTPWLSFSLSEQRKSGLLAPTFGSTSKSGIEFTQPIYWNIAPNIDATLSPRLMSKRGVQWNSELRYLNTNYSGQTRYEVLPDDKVSGTSRSAFALNHSQNFGGGFTGGLILNGVSDDTYFSDLSSRLAVTSQTNLLRQGTLSYGTPWWSASLLLQDFQTLQDPALPRLNKPYKLLPKFNFNAARSDLPLGLVASLSGESVSFRHGNLVEGSRSIAYPQLSWPQQFSWLTVIPKLGVHSTRYNLDITPAALATGTPDQLSRTVPIFSVDSTMVFERDTAWAGRNLLQTLEPRLYYLRIPVRDQRMFPIFDTGLADFNFAQIFSENRYVGGDRIGDADQVTAMLSSRLIDPATGAEVLRGSFGQRIYFTTQQVGLPGEVLRTDRQTDVLAELSGQILPYTQGNSAWQYNPRSGKTERFNVGARFQPEPGKILNTSYRYTYAVAGTSQPGISQIDLSGQWPLISKWQGVGRYNYSFKEKRIVETLAGVEYAEDCWAARFVLQRLATQTQVSTTALFLQLELNGFSRIGSNPLETLKRSIPGYGIINQPTADPAFAAN